MLEKNRQLIKNREILLHEPLIVNSSFSSIENLRHLAREDGPKSLNPCPPILALGFPDLETG